MLRLASLLALLVLLLPAAATATPEDDAKASLTAFFEALERGDAPAVCGLLSTGYLKRLGSTADCVEAFTPPNPDVESRQLLRRAAGWLQESSAAVFASPRVLRQSLQAELDVSVVLGSGPLLARNGPPNLIVIDTKRSNSKRVVLYNESDSGIIWQAVVPLLAAPKLSKAAVAGIPAPKPETGPLRMDGVLLTNPETAFVVVVDTTGGREFELVCKLRLEPVGWRLDGLFVDLTSAFAD